MEEILDDNALSQQKHLSDASLGARILHYLLDPIIVIGGLTGLDFIMPFGDLEKFLVLAIYYPTMEITTGKTLAKFITKTRVVNEKGEKPEALTILGRNLARLIPFDNLSFLFGSRGWHDSVSGTRVVKD